MGTGASVARGVEAYVFINGRRNGREAELWWLDQGYLVNIVDENNMPIHENHLSSDDTTDIDTDADTDMDSQERMIRDEVPYYSREEIDEMFPPAIEAVDWEEVDPEGRAFLAADAVWNEWWNERDNNVTYSSDWIASDSDSADVVPPPENTENAASPYQDELDDDGTFRSDFVAFDTVSD